MCLCGLGLCACNWKVADSNPLATIGPWAKLLTPIAPGPLDAGWPCSQTLKLALTCVFFCVPREDGICRKYPGSSRGSLLSLSCVCLIGDQECICENQRIFMYLYLYRWKISITIISLSVLRKEWHMIISLGKQPAMILKPKMLITGKSKMSFRSCEFCPEWVWRTTSETILLHRKAKLVLFVVFQ